MADGDQTEPKPEVTGKLAELDQLTGRAEALADDAAHRAEGLANDSIEAFRSLGGPLAEDGNFVPMERLPFANAFLNQRETLADLAATIKNRGLPPQPDIEKPEWMKDAVPSMLTYKYYHNELAATYGGSDYLARFAADIRQWGNIMAWRDWRFLIFIEIPDSGRVDLHVYAESEAAKSWLDRNDEPDESEENPMLTQWLDDRTLVQAQQEQLDAIGSVISARAAYVDQEY